MFQVNSRSSGERFKAGFAVYHTGSKHKRLHHMRGERSIAVNERRCKHNFRWISPAVAATSRLRIYHGTFGTHWLRTLGHA